MAVRTTTSALTATECAVLGLLAERPMSGYDLKRAIDRSVGYFWTPAKSQIYAVLPRLVESGLATARRVPQTQRPDKHVYRITKHGRRALRDWIEQPPGPPEPSRNPTLLRLFFGDGASPDALLEHVRAQRRDAEQLMAELDAIEETGGDESDFYPRLTRRYGYHWADAVIRWAREVERDLEDRHPA